MYVWSRNFNGFLLLFIYFILTLAVDIMDWCGLSNTASGECLPIRLKITWYWLQKEHTTVATRLSALVIKARGRMHNDAFKRRLASSFIVIILAKNNFLLLLKFSLLRHWSIKPFKNNLYALHIFLSDDSLFTWLPYDVIVNIIN